MPAEAGKASEVAIVGVDDSGVFYCDRTNCSVANQFSAQAHFLRQLLKDLPMTVAWVNNLNMR